MGDPFVADPKTIAENLFWDAFINTGQTCAALQRLSLHDPIYEEVVAALAEGVLPYGWTSGGAPDRRSSCNSSIRWANPSKMEQHAPGPWSTSPSVVLRPGRKP
jgi:acyl-CoA reductase-like NAD-dependent aldehyde dehydrogenase